MAIAAPTIDLFGSASAARVTSHAGATSPAGASSHPGADASRLIARHRVETEHALASIRCDASLRDVERARLITRLVADANRRMLALLALRHWAEGGQRGADRGAAQVTRG
jgi:hypothetical protein